MSVPAFSSRLSGLLPRARAARGLFAALAASLLALAFAVPALAVPPVDLGAADPYSVLANSVTSNGATAMSENLGSVGPLAGDGPPIVLGVTHIGVDAAPAKAGLDLAYGDAVLRPGVPLAIADFAAASLPPGVYNSTAAMGFTAGGTLTLDGGGDQDAVFIFQIGGALTIGASTEVRLINGAKPCNVFWAVNGSTTIGATSKFAGTLMADVGVTVGAGSRVDGRLLADKGTITLASTAIRTACRAAVIVPGPAGPAGAQGIQGIQGATGAAGPAGADGATGPTGLIGPTGLTGLTGPIGLTGLIGPTGLTGLIGPPGLVGPDGPAGLMGPDGPAGLMGPDGPAGPAGPVPAAAEIATLCVTNTPSRRTVRQGGSVRWTMVVENCGQLAASGISVTGRPGRGATFGWRTGTLAPGARRTYTITTRLSRTARPGRYVNRVTADGDNTLPTTGRGSTTVISGGR